MKTKPVTAKPAMANQFFGEEKELTRKDVARSAHFTYRDGFRLGVGIFVGLMLGTLILVVLSYLFSFILQIF